MTQALINTALEAFWQVVSDRYPQAESGNLSPDRSFALGMAAKAAVHEWLANNMKVEDGWTRLDHFGCYARLSDDRTEIFDCAMNADGTPEREEDGSLNYCLVTAPEPEFIAKINELFGTAFVYEHFSGR